MKKTTDISQNSKNERLYEPGILTEQEIESLRLDKQETHRRIKELWALDHPKTNEKNP